MSDYYVDLNGTTAGPFTVEELKTLYLAGSVPAGSIVCTPQSVQWIPIETLKPLFAASEIERSRAALPPIMPVPTQAGPEAKASVQDRTAGAGESPQRRSSGAEAGAGVCFALGLIFLMIPFPTFLIYAPLFFISFILGIVVMAQGRPGVGILIVLLNLFGVPVAWVAAMALGLGTWGSIATQLHRPAETNAPAWNQPR